LLQIFNRSVMGLVQPFTIEKRTSLGLLWCSSCSPGGRKRCSFCSARTTAGRVAASMCDQRWIPCESTPPTKSVVRKAATPGRGLVAAIAPVAVTRLSPAL
jgi:hypothetical protein